MLDSKTILIFDGNSYSTLDLSDVIQESDGCVAGPVATLSETLTILDTTIVGGAIVDCSLAEASEVAMLLAERGVPLVLQTCGSLPQPLADLGDQASVLVRPVDSRTIVETMLMKIGQVESRASNTLGCEPKQV
jgi:hypothetical protein